MLQSGTDASHHLFVFRLQINLGRVHNKTETKMLLLTPMAKLRTGDWLWSKNWQIAGWVEHLIPGRVESRVGERC